MLKHLLLIASVLSLNACANISEKYVEATDKMGLTPKYDQLNRASIVNGYIRYAPKGTPDGEFSGTDSQGRTLKSFVTQGKFDKFADVYYPNGKLHSHTIVKDGLPEGWSFGYTQDGVLRTKILYKNGAVVKAQRLDENGKVIFEQ